MKAMYLISPALFLMAAAGAGAQDQMRDWAQFGRYAQANEETAVSPKDPRYVVILAGTNDIAMNNGYIALDNVMDNLISMCELAKANRIRPVLCSVTPSTGFGWRPEVKDAAEKITALNSMIRAYAESERIPYVDYHSALKDSRDGLPAGYSGDGVHPNAECYKVMEGIVLDYLK